MTKRQAVEALDYSMRDIMGRNRSVGRLLSLVEISSMSSLLYVKDPGLKLFVLPC
jgi:hypothetical protein